MKVIPFKRSTKFTGKPRSRPFVRVDWEFIDDMRVKPQDKLCWMMIRRFLNKEGKCWPTNRQIGLLCGCKERSINDKINRLKRLGYLDWEHFRDKYGHQRNRYWFPSVGYLSLQQHSAGGLQHSSAGKVDYTYSLSEIPDAPACSEPERLQETGM
jgi:hypothetical protein